MSKTTFSRKELYDLVWSESLPTLSKRLDVRYEDLKSICKTMKIPLPKSGHWMKVWAGKKVVKELLPENYTGRQEITFPLEADKTELTELTRSPATVLQHEIENKFKSLLKIPSKLIDPDKLIVATQTILKECESSEYYRHPEKVSATRDGGLNISVTPKHIDRALRFFNAFIQLLRARRHDILIRNDETYAVVEEKEIRIGLREITRRVVVTRNHWTTSEYHPTGVLCFKMDTVLGVEWQDGKLPLEHKLSKIIAKLELYGREWKQRRIENQKAEEERKEQERKQLERKQRKEKELSDFKKVLQQAHRSHEALILRNYIDEVEKRATASDSLTEEVKKWILWARRKADWYDPFIDAEDNLLKEVDRETLAFPQEKHLYQ